MSEGSIWIRFLQAWGRWDRGFTKRRPALAAALTAAPAIVFVLAARIHGPAGQMLKLIAAGIGAAALLAFAVLMIFVARSRRTSRRDIDSYLERRAAERR